jgi:hypothetical protein
MRMRHIVVCGLFRSTVSFHSISKTARFSKKSYWTQNVCFDFLYYFRLRRFSFYDEMGAIWSKMYIGLHVMYPMFLTNFNETWILSLDFRERLKFHENPPRGSRGVPCGWTDMKKLIVAFRNFAKAPEKGKNRNTVQSLLTNQQNGTERYRKSIRYLKWLIN